MSDPTPGPWEAIGTDPNEGGDWFWIVAPAVHGFPRDIASVNGSQSDPVQQANARLIASAPDLLEALEGLLSHDAHPDCPMELLDKADAAISKARGQ